MAELQGKVLSVGITEGQEPDVRRCTLTVLIDSGSELFMSNGFVKDKETWRLCSTDETVGARVKVRYTTKPKSDNPAEVYYNMQSMEVIPAAAPEYMPEQAIEGRVHASSLMMGGKDALIVDQVLLKAAVELMNGPRDMNKDEATETVIGLWDQIRGRHLPKVEAEEEWTEL